MIGSIHGHEIVALTDHILSSDWATLADLCPVASFIFDIRNCLGVVLQQAKVQEERHLFALTVKHQCIHA